MRKGACIDHGHAGDAAGYHRALATVNGKRICTRLHRLVYCQHNNVSLESIAGLVVRHTCDNPRCVNPEHLIIGTQLDNIADRCKRGRTVVPHGATHHNATLTDEQCEWIRQHHEVRHPEYNAAALSRRFGISATAIRNIARGKYRCEQ